MPQQQGHNADSKRIALGLVQVRTRCRARTPLVGARNQYRVPGRVPAGSLLVPWHSLYIPWRSQLVPSWFRRCPWPTFRLSIAGDDVDAPHRDCSGASACLTTPSVHGSKANADATGRNSSSGACGASSSGNAAQLEAGARATPAAGAAAPPGSDATANELHAYAVPLRQSGILLGSYLHRSLATVERQGFTNTPDLHTLLKDHYNLAASRRLRLRQSLPGH